MRTLLAESRPPQFLSEKRLPKPQTAAERSTEQVARIFREAAVLASLHDLVEVGAEGKVTATPGAMDTKEAIQAPGRGIAVINSESLT
jgi:hypothetical protein